MNPSGRDIISAMDIRQLIEISPDDFRHMAMDKILDLPVLSFLQLVRERERPMR